MLHGMNSRVGATTAEARVLKLKPWGRKIDPNHMTKAVDFLVV